QIAQRDALMCGCGFHGRVEIGQIIGTRRKRGQPKPHCKARKRGLHRILPNRELYCVEHKRMSHERRASMWIDRRKLLIGGASLAFSGSPPRGRDTLSFVSVSIK